MRPGSRSVRHALWLCLRQQVLCPQGPTCQPDSALRSAGAKTWREWFALCMGLTTPQKQDFVQKHSCVLILSDRFVLR